jgi:DegV family protein with EDD domain
MPPVVIVTDTTGYLPDEVAELHDITRVPLYVVFGTDRTERESEITDLPAFFEELRTADAVPTTSQPSIGDFMSAYEPLLAGGGEIVSIHISARLSGTADAARRAAEQLEREGKGGERVHVLDSATVAGGLGVLALVGAHAAAGGADAAAVQQRVNDARADWKMWFALDTLEFLKRGGRIGPASAWIGSTLKVKPILTVEREMVPVERVRTSARMFERMVEYARQRHESAADAWVVQHCAAPDQAARLVGRCQEIFGCDPVFVSEAGPVLSVHTGPGMLGIGSLPIEYVP